MTATVGSPREIDIHEALLTARLKFSPVVKKATNPHFNSKYADLGSLLDAVEQPLTEQNILITQTFRTTPNDKIECVTRLVHVDSGTSIESVWLMTPSKSDPQGYGSAATYARRYSLLGALSIAPEDDDGQAAARPADPVMPVWTKLLESAKTAAMAKAIGNTCYLAGEFNGDVKATITARIAELEAAEAPKDEPTEKPIDEQHIESGEKS